MAAGHCSRGPRGDNGGTRAEARTGGAAEDSREASVAVAAGGRRRGTGRMERPAGARPPPGPAGLHAAATVASHQEQAEESRCGADVSWMAIRCGPAGFRSSAWPGRPRGDDDAVHDVQVPPDRARSMPATAAASTGSAGSLVDRPAPVAVGAAAAGRDCGRPRTCVRTRRRLDGRDRSPWAVSVDGLTLELRPTESGQVGLFPEHIAVWPWLRRRWPGRADRPSSTSSPTPAATTLALARAGARVTHVDASRPAVAWARRNADLSGLADRPIRWIVDDALGFARREARRGRRYDGFVLDPPSFGHGPDGPALGARASAPELLDACAAVAADDAFVLLTAHTTGLDAGDLANALADAFDPGPGGEIARRADRAVGGAAPPAARRGSPHDPRMRARRHGPGPT